MRDLGSAWVLPTESPNSTEVYILKFMDIYTCMYTFYILYVYSDALIGYMLSRNSPTTSSSLGKKAKAELVSNILNKENILWKYLHFLFWWREKLEDLRKYLFWPGFREKSCFAKVRWFSRKWKCLENCHKFLLISDVSSSNIGANIFPGSPSREAEFESWTINKFIFLVG